jgi:hypothetical protein
MLDRGSTGAVAVTLAAALITFGEVQASDGLKYPDWKGAWARFIVRGLGGQPSYDQTKPWGFRQQAPLTTEYRKLLECQSASNFDPRIASCANVTQVARSMLTPRLRPID